METYSSILAWKTPWTEEPGGLQSTGSQRVGRDQVYVLEAMHGDGSGSGCTFCLPWKNASLTLGVGEDVTTDVLKSR